MEEQMKIYLANSGRNTYIENNEYYHIYDVRKIDSENIEKYKRAIETLKNVPRYIDTPFVDNVYNENKTIRIRTKVFNTNNFIDNNSSVLDEVDLIFRKLLEIRDIFMGYNVVCGNIKPTNLIFTNDGDLIVIDTCQYLLQDLSSSYSYYYSPEQLYCKEVDYTTDIYLCGLVYYYLVCKKYYFASNMKENERLMKKSDKVIDGLKISARRKYEIKAMLKFKKEDRNLDLFYIERICNNESIYLTSFISYYNIELMIFVEKEFFINPDDYYDIIFNISLLNEEFRMKMLKKLYEKNSKDRKYHDFIVLLRSIVSPKKLLLRNQHIRNRYVLTILRQEIPVESTTFDTIYSKELPHVVLNEKIKLKSLEVHNLYNSAHQFTHNIIDIIRSNQVRIIKFTGHSFIANKRADYKNASICIFRNINDMENIETVVMYSNHNEFLSDVNYFTSSLKLLKLYYPDNEIVNNSNSVGYSGSICELVSHFSGFKRLESIDIEAYFLNDYNFISLLSEKLTKLPNLSDLRLKIIPKEKRNVNFDYLINSILTITNLKTLNMLALPNENNTVINLLDNISKLNKLEDLEFIFPEADNNVVDCFFSNTVHLSNLKALSIHYPPKMPDAMKDYSNRCDCLSNLKCLKLERGKDIPLFLESMKNEKWSNLEVLLLYSEDSKAFDCLPDIFSSISQLKSLSIGVNNNNDGIEKLNLIECLSKLRNLEELDLSCVDIEDEHLINNFKYFNKLQKLKLKCISPNNSDLFIENMNYISSLVELSVEYISERIYMNESFLRELPNLQFFLIGGVDQMEHFLEIEEYPEFKSPNNNCCDEKYKMIDEKFHKLIQQFEKFMRYSKHSCEEYIYQFTKHIEAIRPYFQDEEEYTYILTKLKKIHDLLCVHSSYRYNIDRRTKNIIRRTISDLRKYNFYSNVHMTYCGDKGILYLCNFYDKFNNLLYLSLYDNLITSAGIKYLCSILCHMPKLSYLSLENNEGAIYLANSFLYAKQLRLLNIRKNLIDKNGVKSLYESKESNNMELYLLLEPKLRYMYLYYSGIKEKTQ